MRKSFFFAAALGLVGFAHADFILTVLHTNDLHAHIEPSKVAKALYGGYAKQATLIKKYRAQDPNTILLSGGDTFQGTLYFTQYTGLADLALMNYMGYEGMAVGNHEFDLGPGPLGDFAQHATFPVLSCNLDVKAEPALKNVIKPYATVKVGGQMIGLIGATTPDLPTISSPGPTVKLLDLYDSINKSIAALKGQGVNKIILLSHLGYGVEKDVATRCPGLDVVVGGHSHTYLGSDTGIAGFAKPGGPYPTVVQNSESKVLLVSAWEWGKVFGRIKVTFDDAGKVKSWADAAPILVNDSIPDDPTAQSLIAAFQKPIEGMKKTVIATTPIPLTRDNEDEGDSLLGNIITDAMLAYGSKIGAQVAIMNNGGIRSNIDSGPITFSEVIETSPFGNTLVILELTGGELLAAFEHGADDHSVNLHVSNGTKIKYDLSKPAGQRVVDASIAGVKIDPAKSYRVVLNSFMATGGDAYTSLRDAKGYRLDTGTLDRDVLIDFLKGYKGENLTQPKRIEIAGR